MSPNKDHLTAIIIFQIFRIIKLMNIPPNNDYTNQFKIVQIMYSQMSRLEKNNNGPLHSIHNKINRNNMGTTEEDIGIFIAAPRPMWLDVKAANNVACCHVKT